eukprot:TRINITY_DN8618_c0_g1_i2.p1 TRINITY_DN8618_c0_g1~~TRINITY_DN8618_c0_g1_i2.p1  ORF type:complete len:144 (+),score=11.25 TRINITY_DN8618_c0_g1_i2:47-433(+)
MADPQNIAALDDLRNMLNCDVRGAVSNAKDVEAAIARYYADREESIEDIIGQLEQDDDEGPKGRGYDLAGDMQDEAPIRKLLNMILLLAIKDQASEKKRRKKKKMKRKRKVIRIQKKRKKKKKKKKKK